MNKNKLNLRKVVAIAICLAGTTMFSGCSNAEKDGVSAGKKGQKMCCECFEECKKEYLKDIKQFIKDFDSMGFQDVEDAYQSLDEINRRDKNNPWKCKQLATEYKDKKEEKYNTNQEKSRQFQYAYYKIFECPCNHSDSDNETRSILFEKIGKLPNKERYGLLRDSPDFRY